MAWEESGRRGDMGHNSSGRGFCRREGSRANIELWLGVSKKNSRLRRGDIRYKERNIKAGKKV